MRNTKEYEPVELPKDYFSLSDLRDNLKGAVKVQEYFELVVEQLKPVMDKLDKIVKDRDALAVLDDDFEPVYEDPSDAILEAVYKHAIKQNDRYKTYLDKLEARIDGEAADLWDSQERKYK